MLMKISTKAAFLQPETNFEDFPIDLFGAQPVAFLFFLLAYALCFLAIITTVIKASFYSSFFSFTTP